MDYSNRTYAFANTTDIGNVDFSQVMETSAATVRKSIDESLFIINGTLQINLHLLLIVVCLCLGVVHTQNV